MGLSVEKINEMFGNNQAKKIPPVITGEEQEEKSNASLDDSVEEGNLEEPEYTKEQMLERGCFEANGYIFDVRPITFFESMEIFNDKKVWIPSRYDQNGEEFTEKELGRMFMRFFRKVEEPEKREATQSTVPPKASFFKKKNKEQKETVDYYQYPDAYPMIKWLEKKVYYDGELVKFTDLETKFMLSKGEIVNLLIYLFEMSGF